jgi:hypothetical protein
MKDCLTKRNWNEMWIRNVAFVMEMKQFTTYFLSRHLARLVWRIVGVRFSLPTWPSITKMSRSVNNLMKLTELQMLFLTRKNKSFFFAGCSHGHPLDPRPLVACIYWCKMSPIQRKKKTDFVFQNRTNELPHNLLTSPARSYLCITEPIVVKKKEICTHGNHSGGNSVLYHTNTIGKCS